MFFLQATTYFHLLALFYNTFHYLDALPLLEGSYDDRWQKKFAYFFCEVTIRHNGDRRAWPELLFLAQGKDEIII